jgi:hypothetical protein
MFALGYDFDARPPPAPAAPPSAPAPPPSGRIAGQVTDQATGEPIPSVVVRFTGRELTPVATDARGAFSTYDLEPSVVALELSHPDYETGTCTASIPVEGGDVGVSCTLVAVPLSGTLVLAVRDGTGAGLPGARIQLTGPTTLPLTTDASGQARAADLAPGKYQARVETYTHLIRVIDVTIAARQETRAEAVLTARPPKSAVSANGPELRVAGLGFVNGTAELTPSARTALVELADYLLRDSFGRSVRISPGRRGIVARLWFFE